MVRIELATNEIVAEIPLLDTPWRDRIAATDEAVWVASSGVLERIDPATNTVVATVGLPDRSISAITADAAAVWVVTVGDDGGQPTGILVRIDTATNEIAAEIPLGPEVAGYDDSVMLGAGSVWVLGVRWFEEEDVEYGSDLIRIDPATNEVVARIPIGGFGMVMGTDEVWGVGGAACWPHLTCASAVVRSSVHPDQGGDANPDAAFQLVVPTGQLVEPFSPAEAPQENLKGFSGHCADLVPAR